MEDKHVLDISRAIKELDEVSAKHPQMCKVVSFEELVKSCAKNRGEASCREVVSYLLKSNHFSKFMVCKGPGEYYSILISGKEPDTFPLASTRLRLKIPLLDIKNKQIAVVHTHTFDIPTLSPADLEFLATDTAKKTPYMVCLYTRDDGTVTCVTRTKDVNREEFNKLLNDLQDCIDEAFGSERGKTLAYFEDSDFFVTLPSERVKERLRRCQSEILGGKGPSIGLLTFKVST